MSEQTPPSSAPGPGATGTTTSPTEPRDEEPREGPRVTGEEVRDFGRLRRTRSDRYVAGVGGGLGRHLDVDPTVVRAVLAVLTLFGGAGLLVYLAVWLLVPEDGADRAPVDLGADVAKVLVLGAAVVAAFIVLGVPWGGSDWPWVPWPLLVLAALVVWLVTRRRERSGATPPGVWSDASPTAAPPVGSAPASWQPSPAPRPRRTGLVLFWPTLAVVVLALGVLGLVDVAYELPLSAYPVLALAVTGLGLLLGAFVGRPGGLIALGLLLSGAVAVTSAADLVDLGGPYRQQVEAPRTADPIEARNGLYRVDSGDFTLDLTRLADLDALDGRTLTVRMDVGELSVRVPDEGLNVEVDGAIRYAGEVRVGDTVGDDPVLVGGVGRQQGSARIEADPDDPTVRLDLQLGTGQIDVTRDAGTAR